MGFLFLDEAGELVGSTGLAVFDAEHEALAVADDVSGSADRVVALWWPREHLDPSFPPPVDVLFSGSLRRATSADIALPAPDWSGSARVDEAMVPTPPPFPIGASWLPACDDRFEGAGACTEEEWVAEIACGDGPVYCEAKLRQEGCDLELDASRCDLGALVLAVASRGSVCVPEVPQHGCMRSSGGFECKGIESTCSVAIRGRLDQPLLAVRERVPFLPASFQAPGSVQDFGFSHFGQTDAGYSPDFAVSGPMLGVITLDGRYQDHTEETEPGRLVVLRTADLKLVASSTIPPGARRIGRDPSSDGFIIAFDEPLRVARTDAVGRILELIEIPVDPALRATPDAKVIATWVSGEDDVVALSAVVDPRAETGSQAELRPASVIRLLDPGTLQVVGSRDFPQSRFHQLERSKSSPEAEWIVVDDFSNTLMTLSASDLSVRSQAQLRPQSNKLSLDGFAQSTSPAKVVMPALGVAHDLHVVSRGDDEARSAFFEPMSSPTALVQLAGGSASGAPSAVLVAAIDRDLESHAALFDPAVGRFIPGSVDLGKGVVRRWVQTSEGDFLALLPWSAEVLRVARITR
ncbi:MAG: hypothetical protein HYV07_18520 [Deltaproteobacteria bacterium]|nr:hypothetical protein [Deltaproteobacteria bacterium]